MAGMMLTQGAKCNGFGSGLRQASPQLAYPLRA